MNINKEPLRPCKEQVEEYLQKWSDKDKIQDEILKDLFRNKYPNNTELKDVLIKVSSLNSFYSTYIYDIYGMAQNIIKIKNIGKRLKEGDVKLIDEIAKYENGDKTISFYSFASKYCSHHNPESFPIYDSYVDEVLWYFKKKDAFSEFKRYELKNYGTFKRILNEFKEEYGLSKYSFKEIDQYLWLLGKDCFS